MSTPLGSSQWMYASGEAAAQQSLKFNDDESQYLSWTPASAGNRKTWTFSFWVKRGNLGGTQLAGINSGESWMVRFNTSNKFACNFTNNTSVNYFLDTTRVFRDTSAWYHIVISCDTTQATASDRVKAYVNGELETITGGATSIPQNYETDINVAALHGIGKGVVGTAYHFDGYLSNIHFIDGQALAPTSFGETVDGYWKAKDYAGTYGTNGFRLTFEDDVVSEGFNTVTYRGNGGTQSISGLGFEPDFVWMKRRTADDHDLQDSVRGGGKTLMSHSTAAETDLSGSYGINSFDADGFSLVGNGGRTNESGGSYVAWCWDAGTGSAVSNTDGSITSSVKANPDYGFSIVSYTASGTATDTVGHGLSSAPEVLILKDRDATGDWYVYTTVIDGSYDSLRLNSTNAKGDSGQTAPTNSVFGSGYGSTNDIIAYCFHSVAGYSSIGSYSGNGSTSGPTVTTGFKPAFVMYKKTNGTGSWIMQDNTRSPVNPVDKFLYANESDAEYSGSRDVDFLSNGFQIKSDAVNINQSGRDYIYMAFADTREAAFWKDVSGQGNHWTPNNLDYRDSLIDSPANNFAVLQPTAFVNIGGINSAQTLSEGNLRFTGTTSQGRSTPATIRVTSGKYYAEATKTSGTGSVVVDFIVNDARVADKNTSTNGDIIMAAVDVDAGKYWSGLNGTWDSSGDPATGANPTGTFTANSSFTFGGRVFDNARVGHFNFGQDSTFAGATTAGGNQDDNGIGDFKYAPPSGYLALCTSNLPTPTIVDGSEYFNTVLYTGDSANSKSVTGVGHQPDWLWIKSRTNPASGIFHTLVDSVRGKTGNYHLQLFSNSSDQEQFAGGTSYPVENNGGVTTLDSDGFTLLEGSGATDNLNTNNIPYVAWSWKAGGTAVSNTDGSIASQVSANTDAGFSIVSYTGNGVTGATVGHSLGVKPDMFIVKNRTSSGVNDWSVYHSSLTATHRAYLYKTDAAGSTSAWNNTEPTSSVFTIKNFSELNSSGDEYIAYCFHSVEGYSKVGSYTGNGNNDGPFIFLGFRPALFLTKRTDSTSDWQLLDTARDTYNAANTYLKPNSSAAESTGGSHDFVSNGFKIRNSGGSQNASGGTYIYLAFAENPFKYANAR